MTRRRFRATPAPATSGGFAIGVTMTPIGAMAQSPQSAAPMNIIRDINGPNEVEAMPGTTNGFSGEYLYSMNGIISGDVLEWRGEDAGIYPDPIAVTVVSVAGNTAVISLIVDSGISQGLIYCNVNGVEFVSNALIQAIGV